MELREILATVAASKVADWEIMFRPTYRHRFKEVLKEDGEREELLIDEHVVAFSFKPNIAVTMAFGMVEQSAFDLPDHHPYFMENARSLFLDIFSNGRLTHRETIISVDRQRCLLPLPRSWDNPMKVSAAQFSLVRLVHALAGPPTDYDEYFTNSGMVQDDSVPWP